MNLNKYSTIAVKVGASALTALAVTLGLSLATGNAAAGADLLDDFADATVAAIFEPEATEQDAEASDIETELIAEADEALDLDLRSSHEISVDAVLHRPETGARQISAEGLDLIKFFEGYSATGYLLGDGRCTIGWGHTVLEEERPGTECEEWEISGAEATEYLLGHLEYFEASVDNYFTRDLNQHQFDALVSFSYNVGEAYMKYNWSTAPTNAYFSKTMMLYVKPAQFTEGLTIRRTAEVELFNAPEEENPIPAMIEKLAADRLERELRLAAEATAAAASVG
jgi:GH24 family phage-related lysozyme (muramidase)